MPYIAPYVGCPDSVERLNVAEKKISTTVYITQEQSEKLKQLHARTKVPIAEYIRQGIDLILKQHEDKLPGQLSLMDR